MLKKILKFGLPIIILTVILPILVYAQSGGRSGGQSGLPPGSGASITSGSVVCNPNVNDVLDFICKMGLIVKALIPFLFGLGVLYFVWGVVTYVIANDEEAKTTGRNRIVFGIIGFVVLLGVWTLVSFVLKTFNLTVSNTFTILNPGTVIVPATPPSGGCNLPPSPRLQDLLSYVGCIINYSVIPLIFAVAIASFVYGVVQYVINDSDEGKKEKGRSFMVWGIIGLTVMVSVWGLVSVLSNTFKLNTSGFIPQVKQSP